MPMGRCSRADSTRRPSRPSLPFPPMRGDRPIGALTAAVALPWRASRRTLVAQLLITVVAGLVPVLTAWLMRSVLDALTGSGPRAGLLTLVIVLAAAGGLQSILPQASQYLTAQTGRAVGRRGVAGVVEA